MVGVGHEYLVWFFLSLVGCRFIKVWLQLGKSEVPGSFLALDLAGCLAAVSIDDSAQSNWSVALVHLLVRLFERCADRFEIRQHRLFERFEIHGRGFLAFELAEERRTFEGVELDDRTLSRPTDSDLMPIIEQTHRAGDEGAVRFQ